MGQHRSGRTIHQTDDNSSRLPVSLRFRLSDTFSQSMQAKENTGTGAGDLVPQFQTALDGLKQTGDIRIVLKKHSVK